MGGMGRPELRRDFSVISLKRTESRTVSSGWGDPRWRPVRNRVTIRLLIDSVVRQTTVLIAQLATSGGVRAPLAHVANQVFLDLANEFEAQGVSRKVSADMFGMALRAYVRKVQRLGESSTERGRTLWEAVYDYLGKQGVVTREQAIERFHRDDDTLVRGVLRDLTESGLVFATGTGRGSVYRVATEEELGRMGQFTQGRLDELLWVMIYREGPVARSILGKLAGSSSAVLDAALERLIAAGRIQRNGNPADPRYSASVFVVPLGAEEGWEAAVLDHFHALVRTSQGVWAQIVGDLGNPAGPIEPADPHMVEAMMPRGGIPGVNATLMEDPKNGHEWANSTGADLEYACVFKLPAPRDCNAAGASPNNCDCFGQSPIDDHNPLCQLDNTTYDNMQRYAKAYPGIRELQVLKDFGNNSVVASICARNLAVATQPDYGCRPAMNALVSAMRSALTP